MTQCALELMETATCMILCHEGSDRLIRIRMRNCISIDSNTPSPSPSLLFPLSPPYTHYDYSFSSAWG